MQKLISRYLFVLLALGVVADAAGASTAEPRSRGTIQLQGRPNAAKPVVTAVAIQPGRRLIATSGDDHVVRLWDMQAGMMLRELRGHRDWVTTLSFSGDGSKLITGSRDRRILVWDVESGQQLRQLGDAKYPVTKLVVGTGDIVAAARFRAPLSIFELSSGRLMGSLPCPCNDMRAIAFSSDQRFLAAGGRNGTLRIWNRATGQKRDIDAHPGRIWALVFTTTDQLVSAGEDTRIRIWNSETGQPVHTINNNSGKVLSMTRIGTDQLAAAGADNVLRLFHLDGSHPHTELRGHTGSIAALDFRDRILISGSFDTTVRLWAVEGSAARPPSAMRPSVAVPPR